MALKNQLTTCEALEWNDALRFIEHLKAIDEPRFALLAGVGFYMGIRISDILNLKWSQLLNVEVLDLKERKTRKSRRIYLNETLQDLIKACYQKLNQKNTDACLSEGYVFTNRSGMKMSVQYVNRKLKTLIKKAGIACEHFASHSLRKSFGKRIYSAGGQSEHSLIMLSELLHHSSIASTRSYIGLSEMSYKQVFHSL